MSLADEWRHVELVLPHCPRLAVLPGGRGTHRISSCRPGSGQLEPRRGVWDGFPRFICVNVFSPTVNLVLQNINVL